MEQLDIACCLLCEIQLCLVGYLNNCVPDLGDWVFVLAGEDRLRIKGETLFSDFEPKMMATTMN